MAFARGSSKKPVPSALYTYDAAMAYATSGAHGVYVLSGALTAGVFKELVSFNTPGELFTAIVSTRDATSRAISLRIEIDGAVVMERTSPAIATANTGYVFVGLTGNSGGAAGQVMTSPIAVPFNTLRLSVASDLTETDKISLHYQAWVQ